MGANEKKFIIVTGSSGSIGSAICTAAMGAGYDVIGIDVNSSHHHDSAGCHFIKFDLMDLAQSDTSCRSLLNQIEAIIGGGYVYGLVNNAAYQCVFSMTDLQLSDWERSIAINLTAPMLLVRMLLPKLEIGSGVVVNIGSIHAEQTKPGFMAYSVSKAGLSALTRAIVLEVAGRIRVNCVEPAAIDTPLLREGFANESDCDLLNSYHPAGRVGKPSEVADLVAYLLEAPKFLTGGCFKLDGGISARLHDPA